MENNFPFSLFNFQFEEKELNNVSGKPKQGLDWAGWDTHIFDDDTRIDELIDAQGWAGFGIYFYLCQKAYATDGYFYRWTYANAATTARKMGAGIKSETVKQVVSLCLQIGLFDKGLFDRESILTNKDMQERFMIAVEKRSAAGKTVNGNYWLLSPENTKAYIIIPQNCQSLPENAYSLPENATKQSKVKESKVKESKVDSVSADTDTRTPSVDYKQIVDLFNSICTSLPKVQNISDKRKRQIKNISKQFSPDFKEVFESVEKSDFLTCRKGDWGGCSFDWIMNPSNFVKIIEGNYDNDRWNKNKSAQQNNVTDKGYYEEW